MLDTGSRDTIAAKDNTEYAKHTVNDAPFATAPVIKPAVAVCLWIRLLFRRALWTSEAYRQRHADVLTHSAEEL